MMMTTMTKNTVRKTICSFHTGDDDDDVNDDDEHREEDDLLVPHW